MTESVKAVFALAAHNPDVLTCIANLSNDEVFTPPTLANRMLDALELAWAESNNGESIWEDPAVTFLDPFTKSGVFLREITSRLTIGLAVQIPDLQERVDHILSRQVFGIGITTLTSLLARRSLYCSKLADGPHSIATSFERSWGNIWFDRTEHEWVGGRESDILGPTGDLIVAGGRCEYCGAQESRFERGSSLETHAYAFIHTSDVRARVQEMFGEGMQFDVVIGNPPYQMAGASGGSSDASIYHLFVEQAQRLEPRFLSMVIPSRWMAGGRGLENFRASMLGGRKLRALFDFPIATNVFPSNGADFEGGVCFFLWDREHDGLCAVTSVRGDETVTADRALDEFDIFVREPRAVDILTKVLSQSEPTIDSILTNREPFKFESNYAGYHLSENPGDLAICFTRTGRRGIGFLEREKVQKNTQLIDVWKVLVPKAYGERGAFPAQVLGASWIVGPGTVCTGSFLLFHCASKKEAESIQAYYTTKFFRFLVSVRKITQDAFRHMYQWVPIQTWDRLWTDEVLYEKYGLSADEIAYIESAIKPMTLEAALDA